MAVALIGLFGALGGALATIFTAGRTVYVNSVTVERSKWIEKLRNNLAQYQSLIDQIHWIKIHNGDQSPDGDMAKKIHDARHLAGLIKLQLNPDGAVDKSIISLMASAYLLSPSDKTEMLHKSQSLLVSHSQWLLKDEWEVVKYEALPMLSRYAAKRKRVKRAVKYAAYVSGEGAVDEVQRASEGQRQHSLAGQF